MNSIRSYIRQVLRESDDTEQSVNLERQVGDTLKVIPGIYTGTDPAAVEFYNSTAGFLKNNLAAINKDVNAAYAVSPPIGTFRTREDDAQLAVCLAYLLELDAASGAEYPYRTALYMIGVNRGMINPAELVVQLATDTDEMIKKGENLVASWDFSSRGSTEVTLPSGVTPDAASPGLFSYITPTSAGAAATLALIAYNTGPALKFIGNAIAERMAVKGVKTAAAAAARTSTWGNIVDSRIRDLVSDDATWRKITDFLKNNSALPTGYTAGVEAAWAKFATSIDVTRFSLAQTKISNIIKPLGSQTPLPGPGVTTPQDIDDAIVAMVRASLRDSATRITRESFEAAADAGFETLSLNVTEKALLDNLVNNNSVSWTRATRDAASIKGIRDALWDYLDVFRQAAFNQTGAGAAWRKTKTTLATALLVSAAVVERIAQLVGGGALVASMTDALVNEDTLLTTAEAKSLITDVRIRTAATEAHEGLSGESYQYPQYKVLMGNPLATLGDMLKADYTSPAAGDTMTYLAEEFRSAAKSSKQNTDTPVSSVK